MAADKAGVLEHAKRWQEIDMSSVYADLETQLNKQYKMAHLSHHYPSLYIYILRFFNRQDLVDEYMEECKDYEGDEENYNLYLHGYWFPWLDQPR